MASLQDLILGQVKNAAGSISVPDNLKNQVVNGLSESILGSLTQTATKAGGLDAIKSLLTGKTAAASSPITALAGKIFASSIASKLGLNNAQATSASSVIPNVIGKLSAFIKDQDGDGDVDINDILLTLKGGSSAKAGAGILGAATSILGSLLKK